MTVDVPKAVWNIMGGSQGSILDRYGGEYDYDGYQIRLQNRLGSNRGVSIRYGKNLSTLEQDRNCANVYTGVFPYWKSTEGDIVTLPEKIINATGTYNFVRILPQDFSQKFDAAPTEGQLREAAADYISDNGIGIPDVSWTVQFVQLEQTEEYRGMALLEQVLLGDTVTVIFPIMKVYATARAVRIDFDPILERYNSITLGKVKSDLATTIVKQQQSLEKVENTVSQDISNKLAAAMGIHGGCVRLLDTNGDKEPDELYLADKPDPAEARKVWRFNHLGWAASENGFNGPFVMGATLEDGLLAEFVTAAQLVAGTIQSRDGKSFFLDLDNGILRMNSSITTVDGKTIVTGEDLEKIQEQVDNVITLIATSNVFTKASGEANYSPDQVTLTAWTNGQLNNFRWYQDEVLIQGAASNTLAVTAADIPNKSAAYKVIATDACGKEYTDVISLVKLSDGANGQNGADGYTVMLSEEYIEIPVTIDRKPMQTASYSCTVAVYQGITAMTPTIAMPGDNQFGVSVQSVPTGITVSQNQAGRLTISVSSATAISDYGQISLLIATGSGMTLTTGIVILAGMNSVVVTHDSSIEKLDKEINLRVSETTYHTQIPQYFASDPSVNWTAEERTKNTGYLWFDTRNATLKKWTGSAWATTSQYNSWAEYAGAEISLNKQNIDLKVARGDVSSQISVESGGVDIRGNRMTINSTNFQLSGSGEVTAKGSITATSGTQETNVHGGAVYFKRAGQVIAHLMAGTYPDYYGQEVPVLLMAMTLNGIIFGIGDNPKMIINNGLDPDGVHTDVIIDKVTVRNHMYSPGQIVMQNTEGTNVVSLLGYGDDYASGELDIYNSLWTNDWLEVNGDLYVVGNKNRVVSTKNYGKVALNSVESPSPYFCDMGSVVLDENGYAEVWIDPVFSETVDLNHQYLVFLSEGHVEKFGDYFAAYGSAGATIDWIIYYRQRDYTTSRLNPRPYSEPRISPMETKENELVYAYENETTAIAESLMAEYPDTIEQEADQYLRNYEQEIYGYD